ncbi:biotin/lipoyl-binding carrier protein [Chelatococcus asaccharovorans]|uniref:Acetyl-CoA carboxylase biotin carboxyl carrier protein n=1 Tax=Chelatococcus asaccharovorans TaxID=28210 RepID=A0A2V3TSL9_9HYPH|nr:biotin/lipoyl-binding carrier protein [Chelatococcus asaccharovorans]MBS7707853.1 biotin/lipoyl-binding carrier protein [Chelatococcus asaccharovorans]PXW50900.1 acetyl-CoA carboxylase biotin carboxyl carrier protein [Chelatococcus asaccharovorans]
MAKFISSTMAGTIWKLELKEGDTFDLGDKVAILESMKMEIPVEADDSGTVLKVLVQEGDVVDEGTHLISFS